MSLHVEEIDLEMTLLPLPNFMLKYHNTHYTDTGLLVWILLIQSVDWIYKQSNSLQCTFIDVKT